METILLLAHVESDGSLAKPALEALAAAKALQEALEGASLVVGLGGAEAGSAARQIGFVRGKPLAGRRRVAEFAQPRYVTDAAAAEALVARLRRDAGHRPGDLALVAVPGRAWPSGSTGASTRMSRALSVADRKLDA